MAIVYKNKEYRNLQEQVLENAKNIAILQEKPGLKPVIVDELPETGEVGILYLVPSEDPETENAYDEYVWVEEENAFEMVGSTAIDLSHLPSPTYVTTANKPEGLSYGLRINNNGWTSDLQQEGGAKVELTGTAVNVSTDIKAPAVQFGDSIYTRINLYGNTGSLYLQSNTGDIITNSRIRPTALTCDLADDNYPWRRLYLGDFIKFSSGPVIKQDSSNRIVITGANGQDRIKVGGVDSTYCVANWNPDVDATYSLGKDNMRWATIHATKLTNEYSSLTLKGKYNITCDGYVVPSSNAYTLGNSNSIWGSTFTTKLNDGTNEIAVADIVKKPNYANPDVFESGTLNASGQGTINMTETGVPEDGLYMFTYGNCQCFLSLTSTMIQNANTYPIRCTCPMMFNGSAYPGILKIERAGDMLTFTVATAGVGNVTPSGFEWKLIKVM